MAADAAELAADAAELAAPGSAEMALCTPVAAELAAPGSALIAPCTPDTAEPTSEAAEPGRLEIAPPTSEAAEAASPAAASASVDTGAVSVLREGRFWPVVSARQCKSTVGQTEISSEVCLMLGANIKHTSVPTHGTLLGSEDQNACVHHAKRTCKLAGQHGTGAWRDEPNMHMLQRSRQGNSRGLTCGGPSSYSLGSKEGLGMPAKVCAALAVVAATEAESSRHTPSSAFATGT